MKRSSALLLLLIAACSERQNLGDDARLGQPPGVSGATAEDTAPVVRTDAPTVVFLGTSLTAGYGLSAESAFPAVVQRLAAEDGMPIRVVNAGLSGETSAGALRRVDWVLRSPADVVVVETGANDGLRALDVTGTRQNIRQLVRQIQRLQPRAHVLLVQMEAPRNFGPEYARRFRDMYGEIAAETGATLVPFLLEGVAAIPGMNQGDGIHPNAAGAERVAANVWAALRPVVQSLR